MVFGPGQDLFGAGSLWSGDQGLVELHLKAREGVFHGVHGVAWEGQGLAGRGLVLR